MARLFQGRARRSRSRTPAAILFVVSAVLSTAAGAADPLNIVLDQATITRLPDRAATIVIGNPLIADVSIQAGGMMVVTGKGYGTTNIILLDREGVVLVERPIRVTGAQDAVVVVYRGVSRESYSCAPICERRITLGDTPEYFDSTISQAGARSQNAAGGAQQQQAR